LAHSRPKPSARITQRPSAVKPPTRDAQFRPWALAAERRLGCYSYSHSAQPTSYVPAGRLEAHLLTATHQLGSKTISEKLKGELQAASLLQGIMSASNFLGNKTTTSDDTEVGLQGVPCHYALNRLKIR